MTNTKPQLTFARCYNNIKMTKQMYILLCAMLVIIYVQGTSIKGLYCKDPDTGKLYQVNSTWQSESFCGNYTCKLRMKNITQTEYRPITRINITAENLKNNNLMSDDMSVSPSQQSINVKKNHEVKQPVFQEDLIQKVNELTNENKNYLIDYNDRYLTESEIKTISEILHTVKKSDLKAIVEIYNIAQDIYKEMDATTTTTEKLVKETKHNNIADKNEVKPKLKSSSLESVSYWYEPLHHHNSKIKPTDSKIDENNPQPAIHSYPHPSTYFKGHLTEKDYRKIPYYYPLSNFQRMSSYLHNRSPYQPPYITPPLNNHRPCNKQLKNLVPQPWYSQPIPKKKISSDTQNKPRTMHPMPPMLLPYPFSYVNHYNFSSYPASFYYSNYPWAQLDIYNRHKNTPQLQYGEYPLQIPKTEVIVNNVELEGQIGDPNYVVVDEKVASVENDEDKILPDWQTEQLSKNILDEVRANILEKSKLLKPLSLGKNLKLEKVGKVIKLDELLRSKRDLHKHHKAIVDNENNQFEAYIEKKTCESSLEPGYFRVGNETEPFPACCPQMITTVDSNN